MKKNSKNLVVLGIFMIIILGIYFFISNRKSDMVQVAVSPKTIIENTKAGYAITFPSSWSVYGKDEGTSDSSFLGIENIKGTFLKEGGANDGDIKTKDASFLMVNVETLDKNVTIDEYYKTAYEETYKANKTYEQSGYTGGIEEPGYRELLEDIASIKEEVIAGKNIRTLHKISRGQSPDSNVIEKCIFTYHGKLYSFSLISGSSEQYDIDKGVFKDLLSSLSLL